MKKVVLGVSGSIAVYKSLSLVRLLIKSGKEVKVIMTPAATEFVAPLSFSTLSKNDVFVNVIDADNWNNHVELGLWADMMIVAPATASTLSKMASGLADNMLVASYLSAKCPVLIAPAMDLDMWQHSSTKSNLNKLVSYGNFIIPVGHGELASGLVGDGRMAEPEDIIAYLESFSKKKNDLEDKRILITAGPTIEAIDPVRFISNHSTGKMGIALSDECSARGAKVTLVLGPSNLRPERKDVQVIDVDTAASMFEACHKTWDSIDVAIFAAAVADYTPSKSSTTKVKKSDGNMAIELKRTKDIAKIFGELKRDNQLSVGFALETHNGKANALQKLNKKNFDLIVLNSLSEKGAGFKHDTNKVSIFQKDSKPTSFELKTKREVAADIIDTVVKVLSKST